MAVKLTYFKESGKYYCEGFYLTELTLEESWLIYAEVRSLNHSGNLPGLSSGKWGGYILVQPLDGVPALLDFNLL